MALVLLVASLAFVALAGLIQRRSKAYTLPVLLYQRMTDSIDPTVAAVATIELVLVISGVVLALLIQGRKGVFSPLERDT